jgi:FkbM family methyltransferase
VLQVLKTDGVSGAENHLALLVEHLRRHGWTSDVLIAAPRPAELHAYARRLSRHAGRVVLVPMRSDVSLRLLRRLAVALGGDEHDLVHTHLVHADWHAGLASLVTHRVPLVSTKHNHDRFRTHPVFRIGERTWLRRCDASIAISDSLAAFVEDSTGVRPETIRYGWPADGRPVRPSGLARELLAVGRLEPQKGFDVLIEAVGRLRAAGHAVRLRVAGEGSERARLERLIESHGLDDEVSLLGQRTDVEALMASADVFVHTARWEGFGLVLLEAMRSWLPIVATRVGAIPEVLGEDSPTGLLVPPDDAEAFAAAIVRLITEPGLAADLGRAGHERLATVFTPERMAASTAALYERTAGDRASAAGRTRVLDASAGAALLARRVAALAPAVRGTPVLGAVLRRARGSVDRLLVAADRPPLTADLPVGRLMGYLRHRAFLAQMEQGGYEAFSLELFLEALRPGTTVIDGGAHIGLFSLMASPHVAADGRILAFEADPYNFRALSATVRRNGLANVVPIGKALSDGAGSLSFFSSSGTVAGSLVDKTYVGETIPLTVAATTVDLEVDGALVDHLVMKLDLEGAEARALRGAERTLRDCRSGRLLVEHNPAAIRDAGSDPAEVVGLLQTHGFRTAFVDEHRRTLVPLPRDAVPPGKGNLVADKD